MSNAKDHLSDISKATALFELCASFEGHVLYKALENTPDFKGKREIMRRRQKLTRWVNACRDAMPEAAHIPSVQRFATKHAKASLDTMLTATKAYDKTDFFPLAAWLYALTTLLSDLRCMWPHARKASWRNMTKVLEGFLNSTTEKGREAEVELVGMRIYWRLADTFRFSSVRPYVAGTYDDFLKA